MNKKSPSKDEALEALDFIINVLREHEKDLDRLIGELGNITASMGKTDEMSEKIEKVEERLSTLQNEITGLIGILAASPQKQPNAKTPAVSATVAAAASTPTSLRGPPVIIRCKQWDDFKTLAKGADTVSFLFRETEKGFQADALKNGRVLTFSGEIPKDSRLLKLWLAKELGVEEENIFEGILAVG
jgi:DNA repair ATPase RecN